MTASAETSFRSICGDGDVVRSALREAAAMPAAKMLPDQFCVARSQVIAEAFKNLKTISVQKGGIKIEAVREACARFAESKRELKAMLASEDPAALIQRITKTPKGSASVQRESEIANSRVCLGVGYGDEAPDMALASLLYLMSLGQTGYGELIGAHFALGIGVAKDRQRAIAWLDYAAAEIAAGRPAIVTGEGQPRGQTLRLMVDELKTASAALSGLVSDGSVPVASEGPQFDGPQFASPPAETKQVGLNLVPGRPVEEPQTHKAARSGDVFDQLRDNVVFIWNGNGHGTGFFISPTHILTNAHVVKNIDQVLVVGKGLKVRPGKPPMIAAAVRFRGIDIDAAILEVSDYRHPTYLPFAAEAREGEQISIGGYPAKALKLDRGFTQFKELIAKRQAPTSAQIPTIRFDSGRVQSVFTENSSRLENIQVGVNATGGNSGSPIINACGDVIGLFYAGTRSYVRRTGEVEDPGDFNFAIASKEVAKFLKDAGISVQQNAGKCSS